MGEKIDIRREYSNEVCEIEYIIQNLQNGRYYERSGAQSDGYLSTEVLKLKDNFERLLDKIEKDQNL